MIDARPIRSARAWGDDIRRQQTDAAIVRRIHALPEDARCGPFGGIGNPERLRPAYKDWWSRGITGEHRLIARVGSEDAAPFLETAACRWHRER